ncbi:MAG: lactonase family protein [Fulvivirga sp.]|nr:lactonase family protein [Fulvivirga sp.]
MIDSKHIGLLIISLLLAISCKKVENTTHSIPLIIGSYTQKEAHVDGKGKGIYIFTFDTLRGTAKFKGLQDDISNPSYVATKGRDVFAVSEQANGQLMSYVFNEEKYALDRTDQISSYGGYPCYVDVHPAKDLIYVANYGGGNLTAYSFLEQKLSKIWERAHHGAGKTPRQKSPHVHMAIINPHQQNELFAVDLGIDQVKIYQQEATGIQITDSVVLPPGSGPRHMVFHPHNERFAYVVNELSGTVALITQDSTGHFVYQQNYNVLSEDRITDDAGSAAIAITPGGEWLFVSTRGEENKIAAFRVNQLNGTLKHEKHEKSRGKTPRSIVIDPSGKFLLCANQDSDNVVVFKIDKEKGELILQDDFKVSTPVSMAFIMKD